MKIGLPCDFVASNSSIIGQANRAACGMLSQQPLSDEQFRSANGRSWPQRFVSGFASSYPLAKGNPRNNKDFIGGERGTRTLDPGIMSATP
jgi:hypothetical protein